MSLFVPSTRLSSAFAVFLLGASLAGCGGGGTSGESAQAPASDTILIGHFASMTGSEATFGQSTDNGVRLAIKEVNAAGGVKGKQITLKTYDDQGKTQEAGTAVTRLITSDKVVAVLGEVASSLSIAGGRVAQQYGVPMISPSSTNPAVTQIGDIIFRVCFLDPFQGWVEAKFARETMKAQKAAILKQKNGRATPESTRFKGLGEMMPKVLWETTLNPRTRRLLRVDVVDQLLTDRVINELMGKDASARFRFIMERAEDAQELDV